MILCQIPTISPSVGDAIDRCIRGTTACMWSGTIRLKLCGCNVYISILLGSSRLINNEAASLYVTQPACDYHIHYE